MYSNKELFVKGHLVLTLIRGLFLETEDNVRQNVKNYGISLTSFRTLWILYFEEKMNMTELAYISQTNISNTYRQLIKLQEENLVVINENEKDARIKEIVLTQNGRGFVKDILSKNTDETRLDFIALLAKIPKEDLDKFIEVATKLSTELIGQRFTDWAINAANKIKDY
jgi:DNA-binding MarR family transcriptional regulator